jgi:hypothetical protein
MNPGYIYIFFFRGGMGKRLVLFFFFGNLLAALGRARLGHRLMDLRPCFLYIGKTSEETRPAWRARRGPRPQELHSFQSSPTGPSLPRPGLVCSLGDVGLLVPSLPHRTVGRVFVGEWLWTGKKEGLRTLSCRTHYFSVHGFRVSPWPPCATAQNLLR